MATFFGEVLSTSSRAVDDDEEEDTVLPDLKICESGEPCNSKELKCVLFACNTTACVFAKASLLGLNSEGNVTGKKVLTVEKVCNNAGDNDEFISGLKYTKTAQILATVYLHPESTDVVVVLCEEKPLEEEYASLVVAKLFQHFKLTAGVSVAVLCSENWADFKNPSGCSLNSPLLRCLFTEVVLNKYVDIPRLEQPNIVSGVSAAVLTESQIRDVPAIAYICYETTSDSDSMEVLSSVLKRWPFNQYRFNDKMERILYPVRKDLGNLYT